MDDSGNVSWTNNGGLENPAPKNIRGPRGFRFTPEVSDGGDLSWTNDGGLQNPATKNIRGPRGFTFTPSVDDSGNVSWTNNGGLENPATKNIRGPQGRTGAPGYSPTVQISKTGKVTTVTITDENGAHVFTINDGQDGTGSGDMHTSIYDPQGKAQDIFAYADEQAGAAMDAATAAASAASSAQSTASSAQSTASSAASAAAQAQETADAKLAKSGDGSNVTAAFTKASSRTSIATGEKLSVLFGKIAKWLADLGTLAFKSSVAKSDLAAGVQASLDKADTALQSAPVTSVNGQTGEVTVSVPTPSTSTPLMDGTATSGSGTTYARGNHKHPTDTTRVPTARTVNGKALSSDITLGVMYSATLAASGWTTAGAWKTQTVSVTGLKATYNAAPFVDVTLTGTDAAGDAELAAAWLGISETLIADTAANSITVKFPATVDTPTVNIPITITTYD